MKNIKYIILTTFCFGILISCHDLNITSPSVIQDDAVFNSESGITSYFANIYRDLPIEEFKYRIDRGYRYNAGNEWENFMKNGMVCGETLGPKGGVWDVAQGFKYWPYAKIREVNYLIQNLPEKAIAFPDEKVNNWLGEAYFLRAFFYYDLVKRYGGIPIIKIPHYYPEEKIEDLQFPRDKEIDVWKFVEEDLKKAEEMLPTDNLLNGRANRYVAAALRSRAMLYAASAAKYGGDTEAEGPAKEQGFVGIPSSEAGYFFKSSSEAADIIINSGKYALMDGANKEENYINVFMTPNSKEVIFRVDYSLQAKGQDYVHNWDVCQFCAPLGGGYGVNMPTLDIVEKHLGGSGEIDKYILNEDGTPKRFAKLEDLKASINNPRLFATILFPGETVRKGRYVEVQAGIYRTFTGTAEREMSYEHPEMPGALTYRPNRQNPDGSELNPRNMFVTTSTDATLSEADAVYNSKGELLKMAIMGTCGISSDGGQERTKTGFYLRKYVDPNKGADELGFNACTQSWLAMRYAEVLLNKAEVAAELGDLEGAKKLINEIRKRAGVEEYNSVDIEIVRNERRVELCFENHIWWDLRRWRTATTELNRTKFYGLKPYYVASEDKYIFLKEYVSGEFTSEKQYYYQPLPGDELKRNPNLYPNNPTY